MIIIREGFKKKSDKNIFYFFWILDHFWALFEKNGFFALFIYIYQIYINSIVTPASRSLFYPLIGQVSFSLSSHSHKHSHKLFHFLRINKINHSWIITWPEWATGFFGISFEWVLPSVTSLNTNKTVIQIEFCNSHQVSKKCIVTG